MQLKPENPNFRCGLGKRCWSIIIILVTIAKNFDKPNSGVIKNRI